MPKLLRIMVLSLMVQGCGPVDDAVIYPGASYLSAQRFGPDERKAAQALSVGAAVDYEVNDPYRWAIMCSLSLKALADDVTTANVIDSANLDRLRQTVSLFDQRVRRLGAELGKSTSQMAADVRNEEASIPQLSTRAQVAVGCLRELTAS